MPRSAAKHNARLGLWLFGLYVVLYGTYVAVNAFAPKAMEQTPLLGVNLAIWSGFGLIAVAIVLALVYGVLCKSTYTSEQEAGG